MLKNVPIALKLPAVIVALIVLSSAIIGWLAYGWMSAQIEEEAKIKIVASEQIMADRITTLLNDYRSDVTVLGSDFGVMSALMAFSRAHAAIEATGVNTNDYLSKQYGVQSGIPAEQRKDLYDAKDSSVYSSLHAQWHGWFSDLATRKNLGNIYLIDVKGNVIYSYGKEVDFATNLRQSQQTDLSKVALAALARGANAGTGVSNGMTSQNAASDIVDETHFAPYTVGDTRMASFMAVPVFNPTGHLAGAFAIQIKSAPFQAILDQNAGISAATDVYLLDHEGTLVMSSIESELSPEEVLSHIREDPAVKLAIQGESGSIIHDDAGMTSLAAYGSIPTGDENYGLTIQADYNEVMESAYQLRWTILMFVLGTSAVAAIFGLWFARSITNPLIKMREQFAHIAENRSLNLRVGMKEQNEIGSSSRAVDRILDVLDRSLGEIRTGTDEVARVAQLMSDTSQSIAMNSERQSSSVEQLSSSVEETAIQVKSNAEAARTASQLAIGTSQVVAKGKGKVSEMVAAMDQINTSSQNIVKIIKVIDEIAFQTNLLALNAAVEAARAGQHGRGFAVVAAEVQNLAGRATRAARETSDMIAEAAKQVEVGVTVSNQTSAAFDRISSDITKVAKYFSDITVASDEQSRAVDQINAAIMDITTTSRENSDQTEEMAATAAQLAATNEALRKQVQKFRLSSTEGQIVANDIEQDAPAKIAIPGKKLLGLVTKDATKNLTKRAKRHVDKDERGFADF